MPDNGAAIARGRRGERGAQNTTPLRTSGQGPRAPVPSHWLPREQMNTLPRLMPASSRSAEHRVSPRSRIEHYLDRETLAKVPAELTPNVDPYLAGGPIPSVLDRPPFFADPDYNQGSITAAAKYASPSLPTMPTFDLSETAQTTTNTGDDGSWITETDTRGDRSDQMFLKQGSRIESGLTNFEGAARAGVLSTPETGPVEVVRLDPSAPDLFRLTRESGDSLFDGFGSYLHQPAQMANASLRAPTFGSSMPRDNQPVRQSTTCDDAASSPYVDSNSQVAAAYQHPAPIQGAHRHPFTATPPAISSARPRPQARLPSGANVIRRSGAGMPEEPLSSDQGFSTLNWNSDYKFESRTSEERYLDPSADGHSEAAYRGRVSGEGRTGSDVESTSRLVDASLASGNGKGRIRDSLWSYSTEGSLWRGRSEVFKDLNLEPRRLSILPELLTPVRRRRQASREGAQPSVASPFSDLWRVRRQGSEQHRRLQQARRPILRRQRGEAAERVVETASRGGRERPVNTRDMSGLRSYLADRRFSVEIDGPSVAVPAAAHLTASAPWVDDEQAPRQSERWTITPAPPHSQPLVWQAIARQQKVSWVCLALCLLFPPLFFVCAWGGLDWVMGWWTEGEIPVMRRGLRLVSWVLGLVVCVLLPVAVSLAVILPHRG